MMTTTRFEFTGDPIIGGGKVGGKFVGNHCVHTGNRVVTADVDADTGRHVVSDPVAPDGAIGTRHIAGLRLGRRRHNSGTDGGATGIDVAEPVTQSHDAVLLTLRESVQTTPEKGLQNSCHLTAQFLATS
jgi:hypothetical protein